MKKLRNKLGSNNKNSNRKRKELAQRNKVFINSKIQKT